MMTFHETRIASPVGEVVLLTDDDGAVRVLDFADHEARMRQLLDRHYRVGGWQAVPGGESHAGRAVSAYFAGDLAAIDPLVTATGGTPFQRRIWAALRQVPAGGTISYGALAATIGRPSASRAVGLANGANPVAIIVPCHRIIGSSGALTGYGGGLARKRWLIDHEARHAGGRLL